MKLKSYSSLFIALALPFILANTSCVKDKPFPLYNGETKTVEYNWPETADSLQDITYTTFLSADGKYFIQNNTGNNSFNYWWNAHMLDVLVDGYSRSQDDVYKQRMTSLLNGINDKNNGNYPNDYYDDMEWLALASLRAYGVTQDDSFLNAANILWNDIKTGLNNNQGGGIAWRKSQLDYKNTPANAPAVILACGLFQQQQNNQDLELAKTLYQWLKTTLIDPATGLAWDGINSKGDGQIDRNKYTYNQGVLIGAQHELYKVTGDEAYLNDAVRTANSVIKDLELAPGGILKNEGQGDGGLFKGILVRYLAQLIEEPDLSQADRDNYIQFLKNNAQTLYTKGISRPGLMISPDWKNKPSGNTDLSTQLSGLMLIEAAAKLDKEGKL
ncbi:glycoside hydrolase family 76 protein [Rubrolithibacter danxiaensis]|uniref:glycoside hydrolase family 76 protein n=1 Tax=Rubrolithibacter danxiaensis TaxID=3390805 RepID=UPI003BF8F0CF